MSEVVWKASERQLSESVTGRFMAAHGIETYAELVGRSINEPAWFWDAVVTFLKIPFTTPYEQVFDDAAGVPWTTWFAGGKINLSEACVDRWAADDPNRTAIIAVSEDSAPTEVSFGELLSQVERFAGALEERGIGPGDTVAVYLPMSTEVVVALLGIARRGALFVPIFSGYGADAVATRLADAEPKLLVTADGFTRRGQVIATKELADEARLIAGPVATLVVNHADRTDTPLGPDDRWWHEELSAAHRAPALALDAETPFLLAYTSGTTGRPKGVVHVQGGLTVKLIQEGAFQANLTRDSVHLWLTDMGWIMGPWMVVAGLGNGATIVASDGAPDHPDAGRIWELVESLGITSLGVSPTLIRALRTRGDQWHNDRDLSSLETFASTGEPWNPEPWWWLFDTVGGGQIPIVNLSGGTEIGACFLSVNLAQGLKPCSLGGPSLGMAIDVFDESGRQLRDGVGELVCTKSWPSMTRGFWGDPERYLDTYWSRFDDVWVHGDWASIDEDGFWYLHGRSDDTLNIAGKRIGPAEFESAAVAHPDVVMAAAIGVPDEVKGESVVLYVVGDSEGLPEQVEALVTDRLGKAFRPKKVIQTHDLPRTRSAKIMRRVIKARALGEPTGDLAGLENPEAVEAIEPLT